MTVEPPEDLLDRRVYGMPQVDSILELPAGTARRWIDGYKRGARAYPPVVRVEATGDDTVTWGEFAETRLLKEFRQRGVPMIRMRPAVERLREVFGRTYPLAYARPWLDVEGKELVQRVQAQVGLERELYMVVVRSGQLVLTPRAEQFVDSVEFDEAREYARRIRPEPGLPDVWLDPLRRFGEPAIRSVPTEVVRELYRAGDDREMIAELYGLTPDEVDQAIRYELGRTHALAA